VHNHTQALKSVKDPSNNFDLSGKELCRPSTNVHGIFIKQGVKYQLRYLGLGGGGYEYPMKNCRRTANFLSVKDPSNNFDLSGKELCRPSTNVHGIFINPPPPNRNIKVDI
jgi:hypothetical protein